MPIQICNFHTDGLGCFQPVEIRFGFCSSCRKQYCVDHAVKTSHGCSEVVRHIGTLIRNERRQTTANMVYWNTLLGVPMRSRAQQGHNTKGLTCHIRGLEGFNPSAPQTPAQRSARDTIFDDNNIGLESPYGFVFIDFSDGYTITARILLFSTDDRLPKAMEEFADKVELGTLRFFQDLQLLGKRVVPQVLAVGYGDERDDPNSNIDFSYMLFYTLPGVPPGSFLWSGTFGKQRERMFSQIAEFFVELEKHPMERMGSIIWDSPPGSQNPSCLLTSFGSYATFNGPETSLGPYEHAQVALADFFRHQKYQLKTKENGVDRVDNYLILLWKEAKLPALLESMPSGGRGPFYLRRALDSALTIGVDKEEVDIAFILDWRFSSFMPKEFAFSSLSFMWPADYAQGNNVMTNDECYFATCFENMGRQDLSNIVRNGRRYQRIFNDFFLHHWPTNPADMRSSFNALRRDFDSNDTEGFDQWKEKMLVEHWGDKGLQTIIVQELLAH
ncbi:hypothetical protein BJ508DRAFT_309718 [Ascobolus immersus RN42]|uniref:AN1-type domain-containing protein n=1 Tax=Ascobolus immersus RN42 TaxID=1160509 RepID=A0A3N4HW32_ASCIM|nr:hypothetical protein BJ508DRAFT_309718 [Ascobolus immersus RN42]